MNARERAAMRRDIQKEQNLAVGSLDKSIGLIKSEMGQISAIGELKGGLGIEHFVYVYVSSDVVLLFLCEIGSG
jgi:hypothetical protein